MALGVILCYNVCAFRIALVYDFRAAQRHGSSLKGCSNIFQRLLQIDKKGKWKVAPFEGRFCFSFSIGFA